MQAPLDALLNQSGFRQSSLVANIKLLTIKDQSFSKMPDMSTMTKFRAGQTLVANLMARVE
jgi:hypothetical protein